MAVDADKVVGGFFDQALIDLDLENGGFPNWTHLKFTTRAALGDYLLELLIGLQSNLELITFVLDDFDRLWKEEATSVRFRVGQSGGDPRRLPKAVPAASARAKAIQMRLDTFFATCSASLDQAAAIVTIVAGLNSSVLGASWKLIDNLISDSTKPQVRRKIYGEQSDEGRALQERVTRSLSAAMSDAGPHGWLQWTTAMRNALSHRGDRLTLTYFWRPRRTAQLEVALLLPREPHLTDVLAVTRGEDPTDVYLYEHAGDTMRGVHGALNSFLAASIGDLSAIWRERLVKDVLCQPADQWKEPDSLPNSFAGFTRAVPSFQGQMVVSPSFGARMRAAALFDDDRDRWTS